MPDNCDSKTNGEYLFYTQLCDQIRVIFDVGCRENSEFLTFPGEVHYFDPVSEFIMKLSSLPNQNASSHFNPFGLGHIATDLPYYPLYESFYDRTVSCSVSDSGNKRTLQIKPGKEYMVERGIESVDFLKIDTEGYELHVLHGFGDWLNRVRVIQFEYGGTFLDNTVRLIDVIDYLKSYGFGNFSYLRPEGLSPIIDYTDHYQYCNIVCIHEDSTLIVNGFKATE
jgi:FkbM family methyltransferase